ncbi:thiamine phosphate synthase [Hyphomicrobium sp.]|uniref:thiamine phosphate synthase n=1 Tax=Hyphomicrobium sp. TaxID=82 RepID=UPI0025B9B774|nr:thiamine phosphate synthase [Hyphomicrobium sp.]MCC7251421.1 thiamine phosphate synthase [Hyphomicrobium sp.]
MSQALSDPGLCLIAAAESGAGWLARVGAALDATQARTLILTAPEHGAIDPAVARPLVALAQEKGIATLIADDVPAARAAGADGVHLSWRPEIEDAYEAARTALGPKAILGADAGASRHDAMTLGEAGADYVAFGRMSDAYGPDEARDTQRELVAWWADVFVVPIVAFDAETADDVRDLVRDGADFVAARLSVVTPAEGNAAWASALVAALSAPADAA